VLVVGQGVGNDLTPLLPSSPSPPLPRGAGERREGHGDARCRKTAGKSNDDEEEDEERPSRRKRGDGEGTARRQDGGEEKERGSDGVNCRRQGHRLYLARRRYVSSALHSHGTL